MQEKAAEWWSRLRIQHKVWAVLLLLCVPLIAGLSTHLYLVQQLLTLQQQRQDLILAHEQVNLLRRLAVDIEDGFRGYLLTQQPAFLAPLTEAESKIDQAVLGLLYLTSFEEHGAARAWKGHDWDTLGRLFAQGLIEDPRNHNKSVVFTPDGFSRAKAACARLFTAAGDT